MADFKAAKPCLDGASMESERRFSIKELRELLLRHIEFLGDTKHAEYVSEADMVEYGANSFLVWLEEGRQGREKMAAYLENPDAKEMNIRIFLLRILLAWWIIPASWIALWPLFALLCGAGYATKDILEFNKRLWAGM